MYHENKQKCKFFYGLKKKKKFSILNIKIIEQFFINILGQ